MTAATAERDEAETARTEQSVRAVPLVGRAAQKYVVAVVLVPLSHVIVTVQFRNCGTAGTILRSYFELAGNANARLKLSAVYVHCDDTPLRSVMWATRPPMTVSNETVGPCFGAGGGGGGSFGGGGVFPFEAAATV